MGSQSGRTTARSPHALDVGPPRGLSTLLFSPTLLIFGAFFQYPIDAAVMCRCSTNLVEASRQVGLQLRAVIIPARSWSGTRRVRFPRPLWLSDSVDRPFDERGPQPPDLAPCLPPCRDPAPCRPPLEGVYDASRAGGFRTRPRVIGLGPTRGSSHNRLRCRPSSWVDLERRAP
jgi:hypothetical protein